MVMPAKRKLFVHIGPPKTGSTSIQHMLHVLALMGIDDEAESNARFARDYGIDDDGVLFRDELPGGFDEKGRA